MSDFDSGNSVNCILLDVNIYETEGKIICPLYLLCSSLRTSSLHLVCMPSDLDVTHNLRTS